MAFILYLLFILFAYLQPVTAFAPELAAYRPMIILGLAALLSAAASAFTSGIGTAVLATPSRLMLAFLACIVLSSIVNGWPGGAIEDLSSFSTSLFLFFLTLLNVTSPRKLRVTLAVIVAATAIISIEGIAAYHSGFMADNLILQQRLGEDENQPDSWSDESPDGNAERSLRRVRSLGFLNDPNDLAQAIILSLPLAFIWYRKNQFTSKLFLASLIPGFLYTIYLTRSRGALFGIAALFFFGIKKKLGVVKTGILVGLVSLGALAADISGGRGFSMQEDSAGNRILAWSEGISMLKQSPLFGLGYGSFVDNHEITAHNSFVLCFSELGLLGYFVWLALIVIALMELNQIANTSVSGSLSGHYANLLRASLLGFLACAFFLSRTYAPLLFLLLALCLVLRQVRWIDDEHTISLPKRNWVLPTAYVLMGSLAVVYVMVRIRNLVG